MDINYLTDHFMEFSTNVGSSGVVVYWGNISSKMTCEKRRISDWQ